MHDLRDVFDRILDTPAPPVAVPVQAIGGAVLSTALTAALVMSERRSAHARKSGRAPR